ncbi:deaminase [uncultured Aquimarina sp.]|uniref:deaminase n=1 Tax=uncultured Aquimarina sp. TaxID=575652 RepID=UPI002609275E|nr:deaminase [uncultured Aquimarina sp.]
MGNKIITEKDFWMCSTGCVPAPFQGTASRPKTKPGDVYITERDTSTASFIDFGCSKYMWIAALAAAAVVVGAIVVGVLTVATGGAALLVFGALAGAAGAMFGGVVGGLLCGQQLSGKRTWIGTKNNFKVIGTPTVTGNSTMTCAAGGSITFMPNIKNWWQAVSLASANYIGEIFQGMMIGVTVGAVGMAYLGGAAAYSIGGMRAVGQAGLKFLASTPRNLAVNAIESVSKVGLLFRGVGGAQGGLQSYGETGNASAGSIAEGVFGGEMSAYRVVTGQGSWNDVWGTAMMFLPVGQGKRDVENSFRSAADDAADGPVRDAEPTKTDEGETTTKADEAETAKTDEPETTKSDDPENTKTEEDEGTTNKNTESESPKKPTEDGQAYEEGSNIKTPSQHFDDLAVFRENNDLPKYKREDGSTGTAAKTDIDGTDFYGLNSKLSPEAKALRQKWFEQIEWVPPKKTQPKHLGHAQSLTHAEAHSLMNAFEAKGSLPKEVNLYVDRPTCNMCKGELPALMKAMNIETLNIYSGGSNTPMILTQP